MSNLENDKAEGSTIPIMYKPPNAMEGGLNSNNLESMSRQRHPVDMMQHRAVANPFQDLDYVRHVYGSGLAMRLATEQKIAKEYDMVTRAPGLPVNNVYKDIVTGRDTTIEFEDILGQPENRPMLPAGIVDNPHTMMERQLGFQW